MFEVLKIIALIGALGALAGVLANFFFPIIIKQMEKVKNELPDNNNSFKKLEAKIISLEDELKQSNERIEQLEQNYRFAENLLEDKSNKYLSDNS